MILDSGQNLVASGLRNRIFGDVGEPLLLFCRFAFARSSCWPILPSVSCGGGLRPGRTYANYGIPCRLG